MTSPSRRLFLKRATAVALASPLAALPRLAARAASAAETPCRFGLVTYLWGKDLALPQLIEACTQSGVLGVELRTTHQHGVEPELSQDQRAEVQARFADSPVTLVGLGSNERFDDPDPAKVKAAIEASKQFIRLSHDVGGSGVKVKGDRFHDGVDRSRTLDQVVKAMRELGEYGQGFGQQVRLEIHGGFADIAIHHQIMQAVDHPNVRSCWNSNQQDLRGPGLRQNFELVRPYFGDTAHVRVLDSDDYPFAELIRLFVTTGYSGWILLEAHGNLRPAEVPTRLTQQRALFDQFVQNARPRSDG
jgi:sugar phosphate isomerase/epimerase